MALINKRLTPGEIAAVYYHVFGGCEDWTLLYAIADGRKGKELYDIHRTIVSRWRNMDKITGLIRTLQEQKKAGEIGKAENGKGESERAETRPILKDSKLVDYSNPDAQREKLNELVNTADDPGEALDALKVIIQTQKADRDAAKEGRTQRVYLPLSCDSCPLYEKARKKHTK